MSREPQTHNGLDGKGSRPLLLCDIDALEVAFGALQLDYDSSWVQDSISVIVAVTLKCRIRIWKYEDLQILNLEVQPA